ncbi:MAG TPA: LysR substrate-binding domain-containing protein [Caulobacteraceae bacterium]|nr:LysR substrate-binding domain-containing protein [Caulobacteraceae bacterium]
MRDLSVASLAELRAVESICRHGGFTPAGQELGVTRSAVSQQVSRLEAKLGRDLFERRNGRVQPTPAGSALAEAYLAAAEALERAAGALAGDGGAICVSLPRSLAGPWLAVRFGRMARVLPGLTVEVHADRVLPDLGRVDAAVVVDTHPPAGLRSRHLYEERLTPLCAPAFAAERRLRRPADLARQPLISHSWPLWTAWFERAGLPAPPAPAHRLADAGLALETAAEGHGVALGCALSRRPACADARLFPPFDIALATGRQAYLAWSSHPRDERATSAFIDWLIREIAALEASDAVQPAADIARAKGISDEDDRGRPGADTVRVWRHG